MSDVAPEVPALVPVDPAAVAEPVEAAPAAEAAPEDVAPEAVPVAQDEVEADPFKDAVKALVDVVESHAKLGSAVLQDALALVKSLL